MPDGAARAWLARVGAAALPALVALACIALVSPADARMRSERVSKNVCVTTGGGKFVSIPGFPGERVDRRLLRDIRYLRRKYKIFITDGFSRDGVHAVNGEHPIGLALDIVPDFSRGGTWRDITRLAKRAEPTQNHPVAPFRWVGYNGDAGHGRGHHLHLSWSHSDTQPYRPARRVYTLRCPQPAKSRPKTKDHKKDKGGRNVSGAVTPGRTQARASGGITPRRARKALKRQRRHAVAEAGGVSAR